MTFKVVFGDTLQSRLLDFLGDHPASSYSVDDLVQRSDLSEHVLRELLADLQERELVNRVHDGRGAPRFRLNTENPVVRDVLSKDLEAQGPEQASEE